MILLVILRKIFAGPNGGFGLSDDVESRAWRKATEQLRREQEQLARRLTLLEIDASLTRWER